MTAIPRLPALLARFSRLDHEGLQHQALETAAAELERAVQETLSHAPGGGHTAPWLRTGALRNSIAHRADATAAAIGSDDPAAAAQELGTRHIPPRPFLAPTAQSLAGTIATRIGATVAQALQAALK